MVIFIVTVISVVLAVLSTLLALSVIHGFLAGRTGRSIYSVRRSPIGKLMYKLNRGSYVL